MRITLYCIFGFILYYNTSYSQNTDCNRWDDFSAPEYEWQCFNYFNDTAVGIDNVNVFLLAKLTQLMYLDQLEYQMHFIENESKPLSFIPSSDWLRENNVVSDSNFQEAFSKRVGPYFRSPDAPSLSHTRTSRQPHSNEKEDKKESLRFKYIQKSHSGNYRFLGFKYQSSLDPELMIISTPETIFLLFRGTDDVGESEWAEWIGTDLKISQINAGGALVGTKLHTGFWQSFDLIRDELISTLYEYGANNKKIWLSGHSLGGALSIITGVYLKSAGFDVQNIYAYGCPRTIGNKNFIDKANSLLPNRIQRFEYFHDPVPLLWAPGFRYHFIGQRNWYDEEKLGDYTFYKNTKERVVITAPLKKYPYIDASKEDACRIKRHQMSGLTPVGINKLHYHSPQWYVKAAYHQLTEADKKQLPKVDDTYPYLYYYRKEGK